MLCSVLVEEDFTLAERENAALTFILGDWLCHCPLGNRWDLILQAIDLLQKYD